MLYTTLRLNVKPSGFSVVSSLLDIRRITFRNDSFVEDYKIFFIKLANDKDKIKYVTISIIIQKICKYLMQISVVITNNTCSNN